MIRCCLVMNDFSHGGAERLVRDLAIQFNHQEGIEPTVIVGNPQGELKAHFVENNFEVHPLQTDISIQSLPLATWRLSNRLKSLEVDVVHSHLAFSDLISRICCFRLGIPHISTYHNVQQNRPMLKRVVERSTRHLSESIICVSEGVRQSYHNDARMGVIHNALDVEKFQRNVNEADVEKIPEQIRSSELVLLNVGRCVEVKRQIDLIKAFAEMDDPDSHLVIVGDGPLRDELEHLVSDLSLEKSITLTGYVDEIWPYYKIGDVFVSSSTQEGLPTTHIEAMAAGLPIVSTNIPGVNEIVKNQESGILCDVGDIECLVDSFQQMHTGRIRGKYGSRGEEKAKSKFDLQQMSEQHLELYKTIT